jgi:hypothetical protein
VLVNGTEVARSREPGSYLELERTWRSGDEVELRLVMQAAAEAAPAAPDIVANERRYGEYNDTPFVPPALAGDPRGLVASIRAGAAPLEFTIPSADETPVRLVPYHRIAHERYATYWKLEPVTT